MGKGKVSLNGDGNNRVEKGCLEIQNRDKNIKTRKKLRKVRSSICGRSYLKQEGTFLLCNSKEEEEGVNAGLFAGGMIRMLPFDDLNFLKS